MARGTSRTSARRRSALGVLVVLAAVGAALLAPAAASAAPRPFPICIEMGGQAGPEIAGGDGGLDRQPQRQPRHLRQATSAPGATSPSAPTAAQQDNPSASPPVVGAARSTTWPCGWTSATTTASRATSTGATSPPASDFMVARSATIKWFPEIVDHWVIWIEADDAAGPYRVKARDLDAGDDLQDRDERRAQHRGHRPPHRRHAHRVHGRVHVRQAATSAAATSRTAPRSRLAAQHVRVDARHQPQPRRVVGGGRPRHDARTSRPAQRTFVAQRLAAAHRRRARHLGRRRSRRRVRRSPTSGGAEDLRAQRGPQHQRGHDRPEGPHLPLPGHQRAPRWCGSRDRRERVLSHIHIYGAHVR